MEMPFRSKEGSLGSMNVLVYVLHGDHEVCCDASKDGEQERVIEAEETECSEFNLVLEQMLGKEPGFCHGVLVKLSHQQ
jgi:hypothetical protein